MNNTISVKVLGEQHFPDRPGDADQVVSKAQGRYRFVGGKHHVSFDEKIEGTIVPTKNHVIVSLRTVEVRKSGAVNATMVFEMGKKHSMEYKTSFGVMKMDIVTKNLVIVENKDEIRVTIKYSMQSAGTKLSDNIAVMEFKSL